MTLVVSEVTGLGVVMVGDSAVTISDRTLSIVKTGVAKVQYSPEANIGFAMWGRACVGSQPMDWWLDDFIANKISRTDSLEAVGTRLAGTLSRDISNGRAVSWNAERRGIHIAGYVDGLPHLYHVHTGGDLKTQHEPRLFRDFPFGVPGSVRDYEDRLRTVGGYHLRNGFHELFGTLFEAAYTFTSKLPAFGFTWPDRTLENRVSLYRILVRFIADVLVAEGKVARVSEPLYAIAFDSSGLKIDYRQPLVRDLFPCGTLAEF